MQGFAFLVAALAWSYYLTPWPGAAALSAGPPVPLSEDVEASPDRLVMGTAAIPFQYRVLVPWMVRTYRWAWPGVNARVLSVFAVIEFAALVSLGFAFRRYLAFFIRGSTLVSVLALSIYLILPWHFRLQNWYPYSVPSVLFLTIGLILIYQRRWAMFYPAFVLATLNRETSLFLGILTALVWYGRQPLRVTLKHVVAQAAIWIAIKFVLFMAFRGNQAVGEGLFEAQWKMNAALLLFIPQYSLVPTLSVWAYLWVPVVLQYHRIENLVLRRTLWVVPMFVALIFAVGVVDQTRLYVEMLPIVLAAATVVALSVLQRLSPGMRKRLVTEV